MSGSAQAAALPGTVHTVPGRDEERARRKALAAVAYLERESVAADEAVDRLRDKRERQLRQVADTETAIAEAKDTAAALAEQLEAARDAAGSEA